jgi:DNA-binding MarR family transcriptional regulator
MGRALMTRLRQTKPMGSLAEEAMVNILLAGSSLNDRVDRALEETGISHAQYNVLRILRGARPDGLPRCEIACRMIDRAPDVTRLIDRLERRQLVARGRDAQDGRRSVSRITRAGLSVLDRANAALAGLYVEVASRLGPADLRQLSNLCEAVYGPDLEQP